MWYKGKVLKGKKLGRKLGFPTVNLLPEVLPEPFKEGVYTSKVKYQGKNYQGALYLGPRLVLGETQRVLEIHILDFKQEIYEEEIFWQIGKFVREPRNFPTLGEMKKQLEEDIKVIRKNK